MSTWAVVLAYDGVVFGLPLLIVGLILLRRRHWKRLADEAEVAQHAGKTRAGEIVVHGTVEAEGGTPPITVEIDEQESDQRGGVLWNEIDRRVTARPFVLRTASGEAIQVLADESALLIRDLDTTRLDGRQRTRGTALQPGEDAYVVGAFQPARPGDGPYRDAGAPATMRAPRRGRLTISTKSLRSRFETRAEYLRSKAIGVAFFALAAHCYSDMLWKLDLAQLHLLLALAHCNAVGASIEHSAIIGLVRYVVLVFAALFAISAFFVDRPWYEGRLAEGESYAELRAERRAAAQSSKARES